MEKTIRVGIPAVLSLIFFILYFVLKRSEKVANVESLTDCLGKNDMFVDIDTTKKIKQINVDKGDKCYTYRDGICSYGRINETKSQLDKDLKEYTKLLSTGNINDIWPVTKAQTFGAMDTTTANNNGVLYPNCGGTTPAFDCVTGDTNPMCIGAKSSTSGNDNDPTASAELCKAMRTEAEVVTDLIANTYCEPSEKYYHYDVLLVLAILFAVVALMMNFVDLVASK